MGPLPFRLCYHDHYHLNLGEHVFPSLKFRAIRDRLAHEGRLTEANLLVPEPITREQLLLAHTPEWAAALLDGTISYLEVRKLEIPYSQPMVRGFLHHAGGSIAAARAAIAEGAAFNIGGGFHHAFPGHGEGFCAVHDVAIAIRQCQRLGLIERAMVIDTDVHHGNGTAAQFAGDASVFTVSLHQWNNYPYEKPPSDLDVHLADGMEDVEYLEQLDYALQTALGGFSPDLIAYVAGSDPFREDKLGGLNLTIEGLYQRDLRVFRAARERGIPVFVCLAGGYAMRFEDTVTIHANTARALGEALAG